MTACASAPKPSGEPTPTTTTASPAQDVPSAQLVKALADSTAPKKPIRVIFSWSYKDESMRFNGKGALRAEPPYRARTDLFGPRGETLMRSVVIGDQLSVPAGLPEGLVPPVSLSWTAMGVFRAPVGATLERTQASGDTLNISYVKGSERWRYRFIRGKLQYAEWIGQGSSKRSIELKGSAAYGLPKETIYRDWAAFRELTTTVEEVNESAPFPPDTWDISGG